MSRDSTAATVTWEVRHQQQGREQEQQHWCVCYTPATDCLADNYKKKSAVLPARATDQVTMYPEAAGLVALSSGPGGLCAVGGAIGSAQGSRADGYAHIS